MRVSSSFVASIALLAASTAYADTVIDPASFASGSFVSFATPGVTLSTMTLVPVQNLPSGDILYGTNLAPVFAFNGVFSTSADGTGFSGWGQKTVIAPIDTCLRGCISDPIFPGIRQSSWLRVDFSSPVESVSAIQTQDVNDFAEIAAFNSLGQLVAECQDGPLNAILTGDPCVTVDPSLLNSRGLPATIDTPAHWTVSDSAADISTVLIGSVDNDGSTQIGAITIHTVPEPGSLPLMAAGLAAVGLVCWRRRVVRA